MKTPKVPPSINFALLKAKLFYFFFISSILTLIPYLYLYYKHVLFLSPKQVTLLVAIRPLCLIVGAPILGTLADKTNRFKTVMILCLCGYIVTYGLITLIEPVENFNCEDVLAAREAASVNATAPNNSSRIFKFLSALKSKEYFYPGRLMEDSLYSWPFNMHDYKETEKITQHLFYVILGITITGELLSSPALTFADVYTLQTLEDDTSSYGFQVLPGIIGTGIVSAILLLLTHLKFMNMTDACDKSMVLADRPYLMQFLVFMVLSLCIAGMFKYHLNKPQKKDRNSTISMLCSGCKIFESIRLLFGSLTHASFMLVVLLCGIADGAKTSFTYTFIADIGHVKDHNHILPLITATHFLSHVVFLALSRKLLLKFGHFRIVTAGVLVYGISFIVYGMLVDPIWVFLVEPFDGVARQLARVAIITYVGSPSGMGAAFQGLTHAIYIGMGTGIGAFICGFAVQKYGYVLVFVSLGILCLIGFGFCLAVDHYLPSEKTIAETFSTYSALVTSDSDSDFDFLLEDINKDKEKQPAIEDEKGKAE